MSNEIKSGVWMRLTETCRPDEDELVAIRFNGATHWKEALYRNGFFHCSGGLWNAPRISHWLRIPPVPKDGD